LFQKSLKQPNFEFFAWIWQFFSFLLYIKETKNQYRFRPRYSRWG